MTRRASTAISVRYTIRSRPRSAAFSPGDINARFGPTKQSYDTVLAWLTSQGFMLVQGSANRLTLTVSGNRQQAERAFKIKTIGDYRIGKRSFYANDRDPLVPVHIARDVQAIAGLSSLASPAAPLVDKQQVFDNICKAKNFEISVSEESVGIYRLPGAQLAHPEIRPGRGRRGPVARRRARRLSRALGRTESPRVTLGLEGDHRSAPR